MTFDLLRWLAILEPFGDVRSVMTLCRHRHQVYLNLCKTFRSVFYRRFSSFWTGPSHHPTPGGIARNFDYWPRMHMYCVYTHIHTIATWCISFFFLSNGLLTNLTNYTNHVECTLVRFTFTLKNVTPLWRGLMKSDLYRTRVKRFGRKKCVKCPDFEDHYLSFVYSCMFKTPVIKLYTIMPG